MEPSEQQHSRRYLLTLSFGALGVVYGDIGTSPLYALRECFSPSHHLPVSPANILGVLSLVFWALILVVSVKYLTFVMRADNRGEGGILALMSLVEPRRSKRRGMLLALGLFGSALLYGDGIITPAISVLSAIEGLEVMAPGFHPYVIPITIVVLVALFMVQKSGTAKVGQMFGPIMLAWFTVIAALGLWQILQEPGVLRAIAPIHAFRFFMTNGWMGFVVMGSVILVVTGGEALYADMGHFGLKPIRLVWFTFVCPALLLNYFGQGAYLLHTPEGRENPFFLMAPNWSRYPLIALATVAASIASQAVISGAYSLTRQAVQLGYLPRIRIRHTSAREMGQIYIASVNWILMFAAIGLVLVFKESSNLAAAYGVSVTMTMLITTLILGVVERERWKWPMWVIVLQLVPFLIVDLAFFGGNIIKVPDGGWFPITVAICIFVVMTTWRKGRKILSARLAAQSISIEDFVRELENNRIPRVPGTAIFMSRSTEGVPTTLLHNIKHNKVVHQRTVLLTVETEERSHLSDEERF
ncbi:MAG TPA: KUP/HAK/KT family potassium transporter, partial [Thermoanaerobaculia bacterium]|nr:KUP/HAK/KT family potassium transporter [Thermoanaerobaculia bacterium]